MHQLHTCDAGIQQCPVPSTLTSAYCYCISRLFSCSELVEILSISQKTLYTPPDHHTYALLTRGLNLSYHLTLQFAPQAVYLLTELLSSFTLLPHILRKRSHTVHACRGEQAHTQTHTPRCTHPSTNTCT